MLARPSLKHIQQRLVTFLRFIQRGLCPATFRRLWTALFRRLALSLHFLRSRWQILHEKQRRRSSFTPLGPTKPEIDGEYKSIIDGDGQSQIVIPLNNIAYSLYPSINEPLGDSGSSSSQALDSAMLLQSPEMLSPSRHSYPPTSSSNSSHISISVPKPIYTMQRDFVTSPTIAHHRMLGYRSDSAESEEKLGSGEMSSSRYRQLVADPESFHLSDLSRKPSCQETLISSPTCVDDLETPETPTLSRSQIYPVAPEYFQRHEKRRRIPSDVTTVTIERFCTDFSDYDDIPGWTTCTHPEGGRYFHNAPKRIFTDADLYDPVCLNKITQAINIIKGLVVEYGIQMSEKTDLVLDLNEDDDGDEALDYYFADHGSRIVAFLRDFPSDCLPHWSEVKGISSGTHLRHALEIQYWWHCSAYPNCIELSNDLICELRAMVMHFIIDCRTSPYANSPYKPADLQEILSNIESLKENVGQPYTGCMSFLGRLMFQFSSTKFLNFYGLPEARLNRDDSVYGDWTNQRTWFIKSISIFLFSAPDVHLKTLQKMWVDRILHQAVWEESMKKVTEEWREFVLYSTVLLNANVAFLAINSVDVNRDPHRSPAQISSYCSTSASIGSIILGLVLVRQNQTKHRETAVDVQKFLNDWTHPWLGLETLAIMFSLPYALLMWGMVSFLIAFWFESLQHSSAATRTVVVTVCGILLILIVWCIWTSWEEEEPSNAKPPQTTLTFEEDHAKRKPKRFEFRRTTTKPHPIKRPARRRSTLLSALKVPLQKIRRGTSKTMVEVSTNGKQKSSSVISLELEQTLDEC